MYNSADPVPSPRRRTASAARQDQASGRCTARLAPSEPKVWCSDPRFFVNETAATDVRTGVTFLPRARYLQNLVNGCDEILGGALALLKTDMYALHRGNCPDLTTTR